MNQLQGSDDYPDIRERENDIKVASDLTLIVINLTNSNVEAPALAHLRGALNSVAKRINERETA